MPLYLQRGKVDARALSQSLIGAGINVQDDLCEAYCNTKFIDFIDQLASKLHDAMIVQRDLIDRLQDEANARVGQGAILASITVPPQTLGIKYEYIEYINRYGPPSNGEFDNNLLNAIRIELGLSTV
jgi:hypothetical protein